MQRLIPAVLVVPVLAGSAFGNPPAEHRDPPADVRLPADSAPSAIPIKIVSQHPGEVTAEIGKDKAVLSIRDRGIGRASIFRENGGWPAEVVVRAYLGGMESFRITSGKLVWSASVQSHGKHLTTQRGPAGDNAEQPLKEGSPYFAEIRRCGADGARVEGLPPAGGWFEIRIPRALLKEGHGLKLEWIDFYR